MLSDQEIQQLANDHVEQGYDGEAIPVRRFEIADPSGVYFTSRPSALAEGSEPKLTDPGFVGDAGFFVHRLTGKIFQFGPGDLLGAVRELRKGHVDLNFDENWPEIVEYLVKHRVHESGT